MDQYLTELHQKAETCSVGTLEDRFIEQVIENRVLESLRRKFLKAGKSLTLAVGLLQEIARVEEGAEGRFHTKDCL